jgi:hypothetical protein
MIARRHLTRDMRGFDVVEGVGPARKALAPAPAPGPPTTPAPLRDRAVCRELNPDASADLDSIAS